MIPYFQISKIHHRQKEKLANLAKLRVSSSLILAQRDRIARINPSIIMTQEGEKSGIYSPISTPNFNFQMSTEDLLYPFVAGGGTPLIDQSKYKAAIQDLLLHHLPSTFGHGVAGFFEDNKENFAYFENKEFEEIEMMETWRLSDFPVCEKGTSGCQELTAGLYNPSEARFTEYLNEDTGELVYEWGDCFFEYDVKEGWYEYIGTWKDVAGFRFRCVAGGNDPIEREIIWQNRGISKNAVMISANIHDETGPHDSMDYSEFELYLESNHYGPFIMGTLDNSASYVINELLRNELKWVYSGEWAKQIEFSELDFWNFRKPPAVYHPTGTLKIIMDILVSKNLYEVS